MTRPFTGAVALFQVYDMPRAVEFYTGALGFEIYRSSPEIEAPEGRYFHWCWLRQGGAQVMLNTAYDAGERPAERDAGRWRAHADAGLSIGCADVDALHARLVELGHVPGGIVTVHGMRSFTASDPDGYGLMFSQPV